MLMIIASGRIISQCASMTGRANPVSATAHRTSRTTLTYPHNDQEPSHKSSELNDTVPTSTVHEIIWVAGLPTYPVRYRCDAVCCDHEQGQVVVVEGAAEDDEQEADR